MITETFLELPYSFRYLYKLASFEDLRNEMNAIR